jgi:hypothetical protein
MFEDINKGKRIIFKNKLIIDFCYFDFILYFYLRVLCFVAKHL